MIWDNMFELWSTIRISIISFYIIVIFVVTTSKRPLFRNAFYSIFIFTGICDVMLSIALEFLNFEKRVGLGQGYEFWVRICLTTSGINFLNHLCGCFLMTFHTYTATCRSNWHVYIWTKKNSYFMFVSLLVTSSICFCYILSISWNYEEVEKGYFLRTSANSDVTLARSISAFSVAIYQIASLILVYFILKHICLHAGVTDEQLQHKQHVIQRFAIFTTIDSLCCLLEFVYELSGWFEWKDNIISQLVIRNFNAYFFILINMNSALLLAVSPAVRQEVKSFILCKGRQKEFSNESEDEEYGETQMEPAH